MYSLTMIKVLIFGFLIGMFGLHQQGRSAQSAQQSQPPNFILIIADDMAWDDCGACGHTNIQTPNIDKLASDGMMRSEEHTSELQSRGHIVCRLLLEKKYQLSKKKLK